MTDNRILGIKNIVIILFFTGCNISGKHACVVVDGFARSCGASISIETKKYIPEDHCEVWTKDGMKLAKMDFNSDVHRFCEVRDDR